MNPSNPKNSIPENLVLENFKIVIITMLQILKFKSVTYNKNSMNRTITALIAIAVLAISVISIHEAQASVGAGDDVPVCCTWNENLVKEVGGVKKIQLSYKISGGTEQLRDKAQSAIDAWNAALFSDLGDDLLVENTLKGKDGKADITIKISRGGGPIAGQTLRSFDRGSDLVKSVSINISGKFVGTSVLDDVEEVVTHELGHALSLGHTLEADNDLMSPTVNGEKEITTCHVGAVEFANAWAFEAADLNTATPVPISPVDYTCPQP